MAKRIGTLGEKSLHASLKLSIALQGDRLEAPLGNYVIDILRGDTCIEVQTGNFANAKRKLTDLLQTHTVRLVHPVSAERHILRLSMDGEIISKRKSPKRGNVFDLFSELVSIAALAAHPNFSIEVIFTQEEQVWRDDGAGSWRRKRWSIVDHRLMGIVGVQSFTSVADYAALLPDTLPAVFTSTDAAKSLKIPRPLAGKMLYCLRIMGAVETLDAKRGNAYLYQRL